MANGAVDWNVFFAYNNMPQQKVYVGICRTCGRDVARPNYGTNGMKVHMEIHHPQLLQGPIGAAPADPDSPLLNAPLTLVTDATPDQVLPKKYEVHAVIDHRWNTKKGWGNKGRMEYRVRWAGKYKKARHDTWEPFTHFETAMQALNNYIQFGLNV